MCPISEEAEALVRKIDHAIEVRKELGVGEPGRLHLSPKAFELLKPLLLAEEIDGEWEYYYKGLRVFIGLFQPK